MIRIPPMMPFLNGRDRLYIRKIYIWYRIRLDTVGYKWIQLGTDGLTDGYSWIQMDTVGYRWIQMDTDGYRWIQIYPNISKYIQIYLIYLDTDAVNEHACLWYMIPKSNPSFKFMWVVVKLMTTNQLLSSPLLYVPLNFGNENDISYGGILVFRWRPAHS